MRVWRVVGEQLAAIANVLRNRDLRRLELAWGGFFVADWATLVSLSVWAYARGGASSVGLLGLVRVLPAALALPFGSMVADRFPRHRLLACVYALQAVVLAAVAATARAGGPPWAIYVLLAIVGVLAAPCRPAQLALAPVLARMPAELVAANVTAMTFEGLATLVGPGLAAVLLAAAGPWLGVAVAAAACLANALLIAGL